MFSEKLDLLMHITEVSNVQLAVEVHMDPSYISKLRNGKRTLPKQSDFLMDASSYLAGQIQNPAQKELLERLTQGKWPEDKNQATNLVYKWLYEERSSTDAIDRLLEQIGRPLVRPMVKGSSKKREKNQEKIEPFYYSIEGKRKAVIKFFNLILDSDQPNHLKLFSEEEMSWMIGDPVFLGTWKSMLKEILLRGNHITIVHSLSRDLDELLEAVIQWLPMYMTGAISPYYCPRKRDGIFQKTIFLAPSLAAITSNSVSNNAKDMLNVFLTDPMALKAIELEYDRYLKLCRPLMDIVSSDFANQYQRLYWEIDAYGGDIYYKAKLPTLGSMPESLAEKISRAHNVDVLSVQKEARKELQHLLEMDEVHEVLQMPDMLLHEEKILMRQNGYDVYYEPEDLREHYREILKLLQKNDNYYVYFSDAIEANLNLIVKSGGGVILERIDAPHALFGITEPVMSSAFLNHMEETCRHAKIKNKKEVIVYLERLLA